MKKEIIEYTDRQLIIHSDGSYEKIEKQVKKTFFSLDKRDFDRTLMNTTYSMKSILESYEESKMNW